MSFEDLASEIKDRIRGSNGNRPGRDEWTLTDKVYSLAERSVDGEDRKRLASAVLLLLGEMSFSAVSREATAEWPAGLFQVATRVNWTAEERKVLAARIQALVPFHSSWSMGEAFDGLGSPRLEFLRLVRTLKSAKELTSDPLEMFWWSLKYTDLGCQETGALLGLIASCGSELDALWYLPGDETKRDLVFRFLVQEYERFGCDSKKLARLLPMAMPASPAWVARAIDWIG